MTPAPLEIRLFGPLSVSVHDTPISRWRTRSVSWLLALLVLRHDRPVERSWLAGTLWPDSSETGALRNLRDDLMHLRRALGEEAERIESPGRDRLLFAAGGASIDVVDFDRWIKAGDEPSLARAVAAYRGALLEGCLEEWVGPERERRAAECLTALERLAERLQGAALEIILPIAAARLTAEVLELAAAVSSAQRDLQLGLHRYGAAETLRRERLLTLRALRPARKELDLAAARDRLGAAVFEAALAEGRAMPLDELFPPS